MGTDVHDAMASATPRLLDQDEGVKLALSAVDLSWSLKDMVGV